MMTEQTIILGNGQYVPARIIGQLGVHYDTHNRNWVMVTHIKSGAFIAAFSWFDDALEFAAQADKMMPFDDYIAEIINVGVKRAKSAFIEQIHSILKIRSSYTTWIPESDERPTMGRKRIKEHVQP